MEKTIELLRGYADKRGTAHKTVSFGKRLAGKDLFLLDADPLAQTDIGKQVRILACAMTRFGDLTMPPSFLVFQSLGQNDFRALSDTYDAFIAEGMEGREAGIISETELRLAFGFEQNGAVYDLVTFGAENTVGDLLKAAQYEGVSKICFLAGRSIVKLKSSETGAEQAGPVDLTWFENLDAADVWAIAGGFTAWAASFRAQYLAELRQATTGANSDNTGNGLALASAGD